VGLPAGAGRSFGLLGRHGMARSVGIIADKRAEVKWGPGSFGGIALLGFEPTAGNQTARSAPAAESQQRCGFGAAGATSRTSGSFAECRGRSSESWVRSSISWVLVGLIVGSFVEKRPKCAAIRSISNANGAYSGTVFIPMCRQAAHNPRKGAARRTISRADVPPGATCFAKL
jgi:hypothetical protein